MVVLILAEWVLVVKKTQNKTKQIDMIVFNDYNFFSFRKCSQPVCLVENKDR